MERSSLTQEDVEKLMKKYHLSSFSALAAGDVLASNPPLKHIVVYEHTLSEGLIFPLSSFISATLAHMCVYPCQLLQNSVRVLIGFELLCFYHDIPCDPHHFFQLFGLARLGNCFYFLPRLKSPRIHFNLPNPSNQWCDKFFFLEYDMGTFPEKPLNLENSKKYQLEMECPDVHARFRVSRVMDLSNEWDNVLVRDYLKLARESVFTDYTWPSESDWLRALNDWKKAFEGRSLSRKDYEKFGAKVVENAMDRRVGESFDAQEGSFSEGEDEFLESSIHREVEFTEDGDFIRSRKRRISELAMEEAAEEPAPARAKICYCSNISNHDVEGDNFELDDGVLEQLTSGGLAGTPITPLGRNCFSQNLPAVEESPADMTSLAADMRKITNRFLSSVMGYEEKLTKLKEALDKKTAECQAWEEKFNMSQKEHEHALLRREGEFEHELKKCLNERVLERKEFEKLLKDQKSELKLLKEQNEALDAALNKVKVSFVNGLSDIENARSLHRK